MKEYVGKCVTLAGMTGPWKHIGVIVEVREILGINVAQVFWNDGVTMPIRLDSLSFIT